MPLPIMDLTAINTVLGLANYGQNRKQSLESQILMNMEQREVYFYQTLLEQNEKIIKQNEKIIELLGGKNE